MLWIGGQVSAVTVMMRLLIPSLVCFITAFSMITFMLKGDLSQNKLLVEERDEPLGLFVLIMGLGSLVFVPIFKLLTGLPPFAGMIFSLSVMWFLTDIIHRKKKEREHLRVTQVLPKVDISGPLFFLGILLAINALETAGILGKLSTFIDQNISNPYTTVALIGLASSVVDNIPLVAAAIGMYDITQYPLDSNFWQLMAYCAGTGGSILIIGSAAGVVYMSMEKVDFITYVKRISAPALVGYFAGIFTFWMMS